MSGLRPNWFSMQARGVGGASISILSDIGMGGEGDVTAAGFAKALKAIGNTSRLHINITSNGGDVATGFSIYNLLASHRAHKVVTINGIAASIASVIAMAGDEIVMPENSAIMIHRPWGAGVGAGDVMKSFGDSLIRVQELITDIYVKRTKQPRDVIEQMMLEETWIGAEEAVKLGFATKVVAPEQMVASLAPRNLSKFTKIPEAVAASLTGKQAPKPKPRDPIAEIRAKSFAGFAEKPKAAPKSFDEIATPAFAKFNAARRSENDGGGDA